MWKGLETRDQFNHSNMCEHGILLACNMLSCGMFSLIKILERLVGPDVQGIVPLHGNVLSNPNGDKNSWNIKLPWEKHTERKMKL